MQNPCWRTPRFDDQGIFIGPLPPRSPAQLRSTLPTKRPRVPLPVDSGLQACAMKIAGHLFYSWISLAARPLDSGTQVVGEVAATVTPPAPLPSSVSPLLSSHSSGREGSSRSSRSIAASVAGSFPKSVAATSPSSVPATLEDAPAPVTPPVVASDLAEELRPVVIEALTEAVTLASDGCLRLGLQVTTTSGSSIKDADCKVRPLFPALNTLLAELLKSHSMASNLS